MAQEIFPIAYRCEWKSNIAINDDGSHWFPGCEWTYNLCDALNAREQWKALNVPDTRIAQQPVALNIMQEWTK